MTAMEAAAMFLPIVKALVVEAEAAGGSGAAKHAAVTAAARVQYAAAQAAIKELRSVPWELVEPLIVPIENGMITAIVTLFNTLFGKVWAFVKRIAS